MIKRKSFTIIETIISCIIIVLLSASIYKIKKDFYFISNKIEKDNVNSILSSIIIQNNTNVNNKVLSSESSIKENIIDKNIYDLLKNDFELSKEEINYFKNYNYKVEILDKKIEKNMIDISIKEYKININGNNVIFYSFY